MQKCLFLLIAVLLICLPVCSLEQYQIATASSSGCHQGPEKQEQAKAQCCHQPLLHSNAYNLTSLQPDVAPIPEELPPTLSAPESFLKPPVLFVKSEDYLSRLSILRI